jgi:hypothetical protein
MRVFRHPQRSLLPVCALVMLSCLRAQGLSGRPPQSSSSQEGDVKNVEQRSGPFAIGGQNYAVLLHEKHLASAIDSTFAETLSRVDIIDAAGHVTYQESFSYVIAQDRFQRTLSASPQLVSGNTGAGLVIHYIEQRATSLGPAQTRESWQLFGIVNGTLAPLGKPRPINGGGGTRRPYMGVMIRAANGAVSVISQPDTIEVRAWTGYFFVFVPLRVDWNHGELAQGQRCMEMIGGGLREVGCEMRVEATRKAPADEFTFARLFSEANEHMGEPDHVAMQKDSKVDILGSKAITTWNENGERIQPVFSDVWLHVRIDSRDGWIHGEEDFAAVGLHAGSPVP